jgi:hypothetical protein
MRVRRRYPILLFLLALAALLPLAMAPQAAAAQRPERQCFPETGFCISGPILSYWRNNGGLPVFGYPITQQQVETVEGRTIPVQWFERDRLEIQADGTITAGRLGARLLELQNRPWQNYPAERPISSQECRYFAETRHNVCGWFLGYWERNGGLERFGYPITGAVEELVEGRKYTVQYFERRRMEYHPENSHPHDVLLGLLGREVFALEGLAACPPAVAPLAALAPRLEPALGCPTAGARAGVAIAEQPFEGGLMVWVANEDVSGGKIFVVFNDASSPTGRAWRALDDTYVEGEPVNTDILPPPGKYVPVRGFGKLWRDNEWVRHVLGFATAPEWGDVGAVQPFLDGQALVIHRARGDRALVLHPLRNSGAAGAASDEPAR